MSPFAEGYDRIFNKEGNKKGIPETPDEKEQALYEKVFGCENTSEAPAPSKEVPDIVLVGTDHNVDVLPEDKTGEIEYEFRGWGPLPGGGVGGGSGPPSQHGLYERHSYHDGHHHNQYKDPWADPPSDTVLGISVMLCVVLGIAAFFGIAIMCANALGTKTTGRHYGTTPSNNNNIKSGTTGKR